LFLAALRYLSRSCTSWKISVQLKVDPGGSVQLLKHAAREGRVVLSRVASQLPLGHRWIAVLLAAILGLIRPLEGLCAAAFA